MKKDTVIINGKESIIIYRKSKSKQKEDAKIYTTKVMKVLELLLKENRYKIHKKGIETLNTFTTMEGSIALYDSRIANRIMELRKVIPSGLLTFRYLSDSTDRYALINDKNIIDFAYNLLKEIKVKISKEV